MPDRAPFQGVLWIIWDGASYDVVSELLDQGDLPALRSLCAGQVVPLAPLSPNCQTPPSLASLFTGAAIVEHGVSGYRVPSTQPRATFVESSSGFDFPVLRPLIWNQVAAAGGWVGLSHVAWGSGEAVGAPPAHLTVDAYPRCLAVPGVIEAGTSTERLPAVLSFDLGGREVVVQERDGAWEGSARIGGDRVALRLSTRLDLGPGHLRLGPGLATRLGTMTGPDGRRLLVHTGLWELRARAGVPQEELDRAVGPFVGKLLGEPYRAGTLGLRAMEGGDGGAEQALMESARWQAECFTRSCEVVLRRARPDGLVIGYLPVIDEVQHEVFRWWCHDAGGRSGRLLRETIRQAYALADAQLARLLLHTGPDCAVVICSDHGAAVVSRDHHVNQTLTAAGLTRFDEWGRIDTRRSRAAYHPAGNGSVWINDAGRAEGLVAPEERGLVVDAAERALRAARDPLTGQPPLDVTRVGRAERHLFGDLLVHSRPGYDSLWERSESSAGIVPARKGGTHVTPTGESTLRGVLATRDGDRADRSRAELAIVDVHEAVHRMITARRRARSPA